MRVATIVSLGASAVLGVGALFVAKVWLPQAAGADAQNKAHAQAQATTPVVVASGDIPYGGKVDAAHLTVVQYPVGAAPQGAFTSIDQVAQREGGASIAMTPISAREPILATKLSGGGARPILSAMISEGMRAYTIGITDVAGGGGHILPGDRVDVVLTREVPLPQSVQAECGQCKRYLTNVVVQNVRVLGMDLNTDPKSTQAAVAHTTTLEVSMEDAERLALAATAGNLSLALRRVGEAEVASVKAVDNHDVAPAKMPGNPVLIPVRRRTAPKPAAAAARRSIIVVHGDAKSSVEVPSERGSGV
ncbi:MAG TPA: Flp pilus assembly protein CpaB [Caulobacteraceae bacterium]|nr:Flp pilus assembly protein CpaB [Caulobacteraceae bacterium]